MATGGFGTTREEFTLTNMISAIETQNVIVQNKINTIQSRASSISIGDMFDVQLAMNRLNQFSEMATNIINAAHTATMSMARNIKG